MSSRRHNNQKPQRPRVRFWRSGRTTEIMIEGAVAILILGLLGLTYIAYLLH
jgi:hypothetical protein